MQVPEEYGGGGVDDFRFNQILDEQVAQAGITGSGLGITLHNDTCLPYFLSYCNDEQKQRWLPGIASGELITAIAMTEPGAGSDLSGIRTSAKRDGDDYVVNGSKTFITNGINADLLSPRCAPARTSTLTDQRDVAAHPRARDGRLRAGPQPRQARPAQPGHRRAVVHRRARAGGEPARHRGRGLRPAGEEAAAGAHVHRRVRGRRGKAAFDNTLRYVQDRKAFGTTIGSFQNTKFVLAEIATEIDVAQAFVDRCVERLNDGELDVADAAKAKWWCTELQGRVIDRCLQLHGGYGYMTEYPVARAYADARVTRIYGGTTEIMKGVVSKSLGL